MQNKDLLFVSTATPAKLEELRSFCGLRLQGKAGIWGVRKTATSPITGKESFLKKSMKTADLRTAIMRALPQVEAFIARATDPSGAVMSSSGEASTMRELFDAYRLGPAIKANAKTRERNIADLGRIIKLVHGTDFEIEQASSAIVSKSLAKDYQTKRIAAAQAEFKKNLAAIEGAKRAMNSTLKHAQSLFSKAALDSYDSLTLGQGAREFGDALPVPARKAEEPERLSDELVARMQQNIAHVHDEDLTVWAGFMLMVWGGLRNIECFHARKNWLEKCPSGYRVKMRAVDDFLPKGRSRVVVIPTAIAEVLLAITEIRVALKDGTVRIHSTKGDDHLVPALNVTDRHDALYRRLNEWLRNQGLSDDKGKFAYRLRQYFLTVVAEQQGMLYAQAAAGHANLLTTQDHYIGAPKMVQPIKLALPGGGAA
jgi:integrase